MKVVADHWVNHDGVWHRPGETYDDGTPERAESACEAPEKESAQEEPVAEQPKRSRKRAAREA